MRTWISFPVIVMAGLIGGNAPQATAIPEPAFWTFGLSLSTGNNNELYCLFLVKVFEGKVLETRPITRDQFIRQMQGRTFSNANPEGENLFRKFGVKTCTVSEEEEELGVLTDCALLDDLWKLRFWEYPFVLTGGGHPGKGWAETRSAPSPRQMLLLSNYGMMYPTDLCYGENMFHLLKDIADPEWVDNYRQGL